MNFQWVSDVLNALKGWQIKKIVVVFICLYPIFAAIYFKEELKLMLIHVDSNVKVSDINSLVQNSHIIRERFKASSISIYLYQPAGEKKTTKERICYASDERRIFSELSKMDIVSHSDVLNSMRTKDIIEIDSKNGFVFSKLISAYGIEVAYIVPIRNEYGSIVAEVLISFDKKLDESTKIKLINAVELIKLSILN